MKKGIALLAALLVLLLAAGCGGKMVQIPQTGPRDSSVSGTSAAYNPDTLAYSPKADLPENTIALEIWDAGYDKAGRVFYVVAKALDWGTESGEVEAIDDTFYRFRLAGDDFSAYVWERNVGGATSDTQYLGADSFVYNFYEVQAKDLGGTLGPFPCWYEFGGGDELLSLNEYIPPSHSPGIDINTGEPLE